MRLIKIKCPCCNANVEVNAEFKTAICNYCRTEFFVQDENETKEERIMKTKAKIEEKAKESERKYYSSEEYKRKLEIEKETSVERIFRKINEYDKEQKAYRNSPQGKKETKTLITVLICLLVISFLIPFICLVVIDAEERLHCELENKRYYFVIKEEEKIKCASCSDEMLRELNNKYLNSTDVYSTMQNIKDYFANNNGTCEE